MKETKMLYDLQDRIELFYTRTGIKGKSALELGLEQLKPFDDVIQDYENQQIFEPELYKMPICMMNALYRVMEEQYRLFYEGIKNDGRDTAKLCEYHHNVVSTITTEIIKRKKQFFKARIDFS